LPEVPPSECQEDERAVTCLRRRSSLHFWHGAKIVDRSRYMPLSCQPSKPYVAVPQRLLPKNGKNRD
jgi:hypothetical protein